MKRRSLLTGGFALFAVAGCAGRWQTDYAGLDSNVTRGWNVRGITVTAPETLSTTERNSYAPQADVIWHGEPFGDRRAQVAQIIEEGMRRGSAELRGPRAVNISATVTRFHAVTPAAVARAPAAVHNIGYVVQIFDAETGAALTEAQAVEADLDAYVGAAAIAAAIDGQTQRVRIVNHIANVTRSFFGFGPDQRRAFGGIGR